MNGIITMESSLIETWISQDIFRVLFHRLGVIADSAKVTIAPTSGRTTQIKKVWTIIINLRLHVHGVG